MFRSCGRWVAFLLGDSLMVVEGVKLGLSHLGTNVRRCADLLWVGGWSVLVWALNGHEGSIVVTLVYRG